MYDHYLEVACDSSSIFHFFSAIVSCVSTLNLGLGVVEIQSLQEVSKG